jgi:hypothetical protein
MKCTSGNQSLLALSQNKDNDKNTEIALDFSLLLVAERIRLHWWWLMYSDSLYFWEDEMTKKSFQKTFPFPGQARLNLQWRWG